MALHVLQFPGARLGRVDLELLCLAPHPDDAELGMGGTLAAEAARGRRVGVLDLTAGEMASNGSPEERLAESAEAAAVLGLAWRGNLGLRDRSLGGDGAVRELTGAIRLLRPAVLCIPCPADPHPDHGAAYRLALEAVFSAGLRRYPGPEWAASLPAFRPGAVVQYFINGWQEPPLVVDVSAVYPRKRAAIAAYRSQFSRTEGADTVTTRLNSGAALGQVEARDRFLGAASGVEYAEGLVPVRPLLLRNLDPWFGERG
jgi:bacillithiol biosynthesis deacetylase BshB1